jgi:tetratricopeptide (TPR) repeat protein
MKYTLAFLLSFFGSLAADRCLAQGAPLADEKGTVAAAEKNLAADPKNVALIRALGDAQKGVQRITDAIATYGKGLAIEPDNVTLLLLRGHAYDNARQFDLALKDLLAAQDLIHPEPLKNEIDDAYEISYHIAIAYYMKRDFAKSAAAWDRCRELAHTDDQRAGSSDWSYMTYRRAKRDKEAAAILEKVSPDWKITGSPYYFQRLLFYKGLKKEEDLIHADTPDVALSTLLYGLGNWYLYNGDPAKARGYFERAMKAKTGWPAWGFIGSEIELK